MTGLYKAVEALGNLITSFEKHIDEQNAYLQELQTAYVGKEKECEELKVELEKERKKNGAKQKRVQGEAEVD